MLVASWWLPAEMAGLLAGGGLMALAGRRPLTGLTLMAAWYWAVGALVAVTAAELCIWLAATAAPPAWQPHLRYAAACTTFCPVMAVLGARRPLELPWQWIVASLLLVLWLPAGQALLYARPGALELHAAWQWFAALLVAVSVCNWLPTRFSASAVLYGAGQVCLLLGWLPGTTRLAGSAPAGLGVALCLAAAGLLWLGRPPRADQHTPLDRVWIDFRDAFGALWALRVMERINAAARMYDLPVRITWRGLSSVVDTADATLAPRQQAQLERVVHALLRRFVSAEWIARRMEAS